MSARTIYLTDKFLKMHLGLATTVSVQLLPKQEIYGKCTIYVLISSFNLNFLLTVFTFTMDKLYYFW